MPDILHTLKIKASPDQLYRAIATAEGIRNWWTRDAVLEFSLGGTGEFGFYGRRFVAQVTIAQLKPPQCIEWKVTNAAWDGDTIVFEIGRRERVQGYRSSTVVSTKRTSAMPARRPAGAVIC